MPSVGNVCSNSVFPPARVAVCIPTWNRKLLLKPAIESLLRQEESFDIHVFDNASTDGTPECLHAEFGNRIHYHRNDTNLGYVGNINKCLAMHKYYDWISILHSDDVHCGEAVASVLGYAKLFPSAQIIFSACHHIMEDGHIIRPGQGTTRLYSAGDDAVMRCQRQLPCSATFYRADAIAMAGGYSTEFPYSADEEYNARIARRCDILEIDEVLAAYRHHGGHTMYRTWSRPDFIQSFERMRLLMNSYLSPARQKPEELVKSDIALMLLGHCGGLLAHGHRDVVLQFYRNAWRQCPLALVASRRRLPRMVLHLTPVLGPAVYRIAYRMR